MYVYGCVRESALEYGRQDNKTGMMVLLCGCVLVFECIYIRCSFGIADMYV